MKRVVIVLLVMCMLLFCGCGLNADPMVGQWVMDSGSRYMIVAENGMVVQFEYNDITKEYITMSVFDDGTKDAYDHWYKDGETYYIESVFSPGEPEIIEYNGDTLRLSPSSANTWYRIPKDDWISVDEIYYGVYDRENSKIITYPLTNILE